MPYTPRYTNLVTLFLQSCQRFADEPLLGTRAPAGWQWMNHTQFAELVAKARAGLAQLGVGAGDRVAVISNNRLEWAVCAYATYTRGAIYVPMYEAMLDRDWQYILNDSGAKVCFVAGGKVAERVRALQSSLPACGHVVDFTSAEYAQLLERGAAEPAPPSTPADSDVAMLIYTSGTTANPKGVRLSHFNLATNASTLADLDLVVRGDRSLAFLPWAHVFGGSVELNAMMAVGGSLAICDDTDKLLGYLPEVQPTALFAVPRIWNRIYDGVRKQMAGRPKALQTIFEVGMRAKGKQKRGERLGLRETAALRIAEKLIFTKIVARFGGKLRLAISGAAALSQEVGEFIDNLGIAVYEGFGMTETGGAATANLPGAKRIGSVGKAIPGFEIKLDKSAPGAAPDEGEILVYGNGIMQGYHNQPEATRATMTEDGGLRTGDLGRIDDDGFLYITGRVKELYKLANGKYVAPALLEEKIQLSMYIAQCVVHGAGQPHNVALVIPDMATLRTWGTEHGLPADDAALLADTRTRALIRAEIDQYGSDFKGYESIRDFVLSGEELTPQNDMLTPTLKVKRRNVLAKYGARLEALYKQAAA